MFSSDAGPIIHEKRKWEALPALPITQLLQAFQDMESTDIRDRVYGLLGLSTSAAQTIIKRDELLEVDDFPSKEKLYANVLGAACNPEHFPNAKAQQYFLQLLQQMLRVNPANSFIMSETHKCLVSSEVQPHTISESLRVDDSHLAPRPRSMYSDALEKPPITPPFGLR